jgi:hypothetical protein
MVLNDTPSRDTIPLNPCRVAALSFLSVPRYFYSEHFFSVDRNGQPHVPSMARSFMPDHVAAALGLAPVQPVGLGQIIPGFSSLVS